MSLRATRYQAAQYGYCDRFPVLESVHPEPVPSVVYIVSAEQFRLFGVREKAVHLVVVGTGREFNAVVAMLLPFATEVRKLVVVDVARAPELAMQFLGPGIELVLFKMFQQRILAVFEEAFCSAKLGQFAAKIEHPRWRYTDIR
jgi:hypothetical protein